MRTFPRSRWLMLSLFAAALFISAAARSDDPPAAELEKQIADLQKKLSEIKAKALEKAPTPVGGIAAGASDKMAWRSIGPANMGGRITAIAVYEAEPSTYFIATASGGLLKTVNNGITFTHQFDQQSTVSIGDVAVCQADPNIVWVGTGEANPRNSVSYGDGVYKSTDGGKTWTNMGLKGTFSIAKILIHPKDCNIVYVGACGRLYGANPERGLFKTTDGGKTWNKVLYVDDKTGVIDARLDPHDPETLIVAMWERKRDEFDAFFGDAPVPDAYGPVVTHGAGGGLFKSTDGGANWTKLNDPKLKNGLPNAKWGRVGLDYSGKTAGLIFAVIDTEKVGTGDPIKQVYMGILGESVEEGGGAKLTEITDGGPAAKAGLKAGDIIIKADDNAIKDYDELIEFIRSKKPDAKAKFVIKRDGKEQTIEVTIALRPQQEGGFPTRGGGRRGGGGTAAAPRAIAGFRFNDTGDAIVGSVNAGSPAEKAGLKTGDKILAVDGKEVTDAEEYLKAVGTDKKPGDKLKLTIERDGKKSQMEVTLASSEESPTPTQVLMPGFAPDPATRGEGEVKVGTLERNGEAEKKGVKVGDIILEVDGKPVSSIFSMIAAMRTGTREDNPRKASDMIKVKIKQGEKTLDLELPLVMMNVPGLRAPGPARGANLAKPYQLGLGGQQANLQDSQGKDGINTGGVYQSRDNGETWTRVNSLNPRPMYFSVIRVDPTDDKTIWLLSDVPVLWKSTNGGKKFDQVRTSQGVHADAHAFWINPKNHKHLIIGCDGGFYASYDQGLKWDHLNTLALGQFYHVAADNRRPYRVYGGLQDNGSWGGPSQTLRSYGPVNEDWVFVSGGDGFVCRVDPSDPDTVYAESQGGAMNRRNFRTGERGFIRPALRQGETPHRFNWNTPFILSTHNPSIFYCAGEYVWKSIKKGTDLKKISPEITRTKAGSGTALAESPTNQDVIWAGTDDGYVWLTKDGGTNWVNVTDAIKAAGLPGFRWVASIEASRERDARCYVCFDAHRSDDDKPYLFVTDDFGKTWKNITGNLPKVGSTRVLREDMVNRDLLYCGTEFGAWASANRGESWVKLGSGLPTVAVHEFAQTTSAPEIVAATHGRSLWVLDVASLRQMKPKALTDAATLFAPPNAVRWRTGAGGESPYSSTDRKFVGTNPPRGANLDYVLTKPGKEISLKVYDVSGKTVRTFNRPDKGVGFHRVVWDLSRGASGTGQGGGQRGGNGPQGGGGTVAPGFYRVALVVDGTEYSQPITVELDPNAPKDLVVIDEDELETEPVNPLKPKKVPAVIDD
jgi:S1-C subfamily serine protease/photosystem II stability/assembly factor-like uncharacterized protein